MIHGFLKSFYDAVNKKIEDLNYEQKVCAMALPEETRLVIVAGSPSARGVPLKSPVITVPFEMLERRYASKQREQKQTLDLVIEEQAQRNTIRLD